MQTGRYIGVMSGTSLDGIDVVIAAIDQNIVALQSSYCHPMPLDIREEILSINQGQQVTLSQIGRLDTRLGRLFSEAILTLMHQQGLSSHDIVAIGCHGQTVWHEPHSDAPFSMQIGDNNIIATETGVTVVGDFRRRDMSLGGQGAPLVPAFHRALLTHPAERRAILNIGGIANLTLLSPGEIVRGFDTGPGNILMDAWIWRHKQLPFDKNGVWAASGKINQALLNDFLDDQWFKRPVPKSTGREYFNIRWVEQKLAAHRNLAPEDVQATLLELTALSITQLVEQQGIWDSLLVCGGGGHNHLLMQRIASLLPTTHVGLTDELGISSDDMEALAFSWLAYRTISGLPGNLPAVTGAKDFTVLGAIFPANSGTHR